MSFNEFVLASRVEGALRTYSPIGYGDVVITQGLCVCMSPFASFFLCLQSKNQGGLISYALKK